MRGWMGGAAWLSGAALSNGRNSHAAAPACSTMQCSSGMHLPFVQPWCIGAIPPRQPAGPTWKMGAVSSSAAADAADDDDPIAVHSSSVFIAE